MNNRTKITPKYTEDSIFYSPYAELIKPWHPKTKKEKADIDAAFPVIDPGSTPIGDRIIVQLRQPLDSIANKLTPASIANFLWNEHIGRVVAIAPGAFHDLTTGEPFAEGAWYKLGDFVQVPKMQTARWTIKDGKKQASFIKLRWNEVFVVVHGNPLLQENVVYGIK